MARLSTRHSPYQNPPLTSKDEPAGPTPTEGNDTYTPARVVSRASTPALPAASAPALALAAVNSMVRYLEADF